jgi:hypothetical protein
MFSAEQRVQWHVIMAEVKITSFVSANLNFYHSAPV